MRFLRPISAGAAALAVAAGLTGPALAQAEPAGLGTALSSTKVLTAQLGQNGSLLGLELLTDEARATLDSAVAEPGSFSRLSLGKVSSQAVALDVVNKTLPSFEAKSTGPTSQDVSHGALGLAAPVLQGTVQGGKLTALLEDGVASSGLDAEISNLRDAVGGLVSVASVKSTLGSRAAADNSSAERSVAVSDITVLDLAALLNGLGIDLGSLTLAQVVGLVDGLGAQLGLPLPAGVTSLEEAVEAINALIDEAQAVIDDAVDNEVAPVLDSVNTTIGDVLGSVGTLPTSPVTDPAQVDAVVDTAQALIDDLQAELAELVAEGLQALDGLALLRLEGVEVGVSTKAVQDVSSSAATVTGRIGKVSVGNLTLANGVDLVAATDQVNAVVAAVNAKLGEVLGLLDPGLANLVKVSAFDKTTDVASKDGYTTATAGVTALTATVTPPAALANIVAAVNALVPATEVADVLGVAVAQVPAELGLSGLMDTLSSTLGVAAGALSQPASVKVAEVLSASNYRATALPAPGSPVGQPTLPRTGGDTLLLTAAAAIILGLAARRLLITPAPRQVRIED